VVVAENAGALVEKCPKLNKSASGSGPKLWAQAVLQFTDHPKYLLDNAVE
jgi:hypothetical protein